MATLLVSDIHLAPARPDVTEAYLGFLRGPAQAAREVVILGDLFDAWVGDDDLGNPAWRPVILAMRALSERGVRLAFLHGNRDFLLGEDFAAACGARLMPEVTLADIEGERTLLMHGDQLCTDDAAYLTWRREARDPNWQASFLALPLQERQRLAGEMRATSDLEKAAKSQEIMDVNARAVEAALRASGCRRLIHGHTHRPARHYLTIDGAPCERWVLADWRLPGGYLRCDARGLTALPWPAPGSSG